jgi:hypothetical protein
VDHVRRLLCRALAAGDPANPPLGATVDDLVTALTALRPFEVIDPPSDATLAGYDGQHLEWAVPEELCP